MTSASTYKYKFEEETEAAKGLATTSKSEKPLPKCQRQRKDLQQGVKKSKLKDQVSFYLGNVEISKVIFWLVLLKGSLNVPYSEMLCQVNTLFASVLHSQNIFKSITEHIFE